MTNPETFATAKADLPPGAWRALEKAHQSIASDGLPCGAALADSAGVIVADGRCSAFDLDPETGEILGATPLGHAELNVLAGVPTERDLSTDTLWSTQQPCAMCTAALEFVEVGSVRYLAADPAFQGTSDPKAGQVVDPTVSEPELGPWAVFANAMFMQGSLSRFGNVDRSLKTEPETAELAIALWSEKAFTGGELEPLAATIWSRVTDAALSRHQRLEPARRHT